MARMTGSLFEEVAHNPSKVGNRLTLRSATEIVEGRLRDHGVGYLGHPAVTTDRRINRRLVVADACSVLPGKASEDPRGFGVRNVIDQPQKRRAGRDRRGGRLGVIESVQLLLQRVPLVREQRGENGALVTRNPRRLRVWHHRKLSERSPQVRRQGGARTVPRSTSVKFRCVGRRRLPVLHHQQVGGRVPPRG